MREVKLTPNSAYIFLINWNRHGGQYVGDFIMHGIALPTPATQKHSSTYKIRGGRGHVMQHDVRM